MYKNIEDRNAYQRKWYAEHREQEAERYKKYHASEQGKARKERYRMRERELKRAWYARNKERLKLQRLGVI